MPLGFEFVFGKYIALEIGTSASLVETSARRMMQIIIISGGFKLWLGFKIFLFQICIIDTPRLLKAEKCRAMMLCRPFWGLLPPLKSVHKSKNKSNFRKVHVWIIQAERRKIGSHLHPPKAASLEAKNWKARKLLVNGCSLDIGTSKMRMGPCQM